MKICSRCIQPDTRPGLFFNQEGVCGACIWEEEKKSVDWDNRENQLQNIADWARKKRNNYDCVIGVSGGKDSTRQALTVRDELGLHCLLVNSEPEGITETGIYNIENLKNLGFDVISLRPNPRVIKKLIKRDFFQYLNPVKITEYSLWASAYIISDRFNIPLIIQGENPALTLGVSMQGLPKDWNAFNVDKQNTLKSGWGEYVGIDGVDEKDLFLFHYNKDELEKKGMKAIWLQYFLKDWSFRKNTDFAFKNGFKGRANFNPKDIGTYVNFSQVDSDLVQVNQMHKFVKFGFGQCMDHVCYDIREGRLSREEAIELVKKYDGKCSEEYIKKFCDYIRISLSEYWNTVNKFRGPMWKKDDKGNWHNTICDLM